MPFDMVKDQLASSNIGGGALFWETVRGNISVVSEAKIWWDICTGEIVPVIDSNEVTDAAAVLLPAGPIDASIWKMWTAAEPLLKPWGSGVAQRPSKKPSKGTLRKEKEHYL